MRCRRNITCIYIYIYFFLYARVQCTPLSYGLHSVLNTITSCRWVFLRHKIATSKLVSEAHNLTTELREFWERMSHCLVGGAQIWGFAASAFLTDYRKSFRAIFPDPKPEAGVLNGARFSHAGGTFYPRLTLRDCVYSVHAVAKQNEKPIHWALRKSQKSIFRSGWCTSRTAC